MVFCHFVIGCNSDSNSPTLHGIGSIRNQIPGVRKPSKPGFRSQKNPRKQWFWSCNAAKTSILALFYWKTLPKTWTVPNKPKFWCQNAEGTKKNFWSIGSFGSSRLQNLVVFQFFLGTFQRFCTKALVFWVPLKVLEAFWSKTLPKPWRVPKKTVLVPKRWMVPKNKKTKVWSLELPSDPMLQNFAFFGTLHHFGTKTLVFSDPPEFWQGFAPKCSQNTERSQQTQAGHGF